MAIAFVQEVTGEDPNGSTSGTTIAATITVSAGSTLVVFATCASGGGATTITCADTLNGSYPAAIEAPNDSTNLSQTSLFILQNTLSGSNTVTATLGAARTFKGIWIMELSGAGGADGHNSNVQLTPTTTTDAVTTNTMTNTTQPGILVALGVNTDGSGSTPAAGTGFTSTTTSWTWGAAFASTRSERLAISNTAGTAATFTAGTNVGHLSVGVIIDQAAALAPTINTQPQNQTGVVGGTATFTVSATTSGGTLHYQWKDNGSNVGTDSSSYTTPTLDMTFNNHIYTVVVTDDNGSTTSNQAILKVFIVPAVNWLRA